MSMKIYKPMGQFLNKRDFLMYNIAKSLCDLMGDDWSLGERLYMTKAEEIVSLVATHLGVQNEQE